MGKPIKKCVLTLLAVIAVLLLAGAGGSYWLSENSFAANYLTPYIARAIERYLPGTKVSIESSRTEWDNIDHVISLHAMNISVVDASGDVIAAIPETDIHISVLGLFYHRFVPLSLMVDSPHFKILRDTKGVMRFGDADNEAPAASDSEDIKGFVQFLLHDLVDTPRAGNLIVRGIEADIHDTATNADWVVHVPEIAIDRSHRSILGHATLLLTQKDQAATLQIGYNYEPQKNRHSLTTEFKDITPSFFAGGHPETLGLSYLAIVDLPLSGSLGLSVNSDLQLQNLSVDIQGGEGRLVYPTFWDQPCAVKAIDIKANVDAAQSDAGTASVDIDFGGPLLKAVGSLKSSASKDYDNDFQVSVTMDNWPMDDFASLWPKPVITSPRAWIISSMSKGMFDHGEATVKGSLKFSDLDNMLLAEAGGKISASNGHLLYLDGMPAVDGVNAKATFDLDQMTVDVSGGGIGALRLLPFTLQTTDFQKPIQYAEIPVKAAGPIGDILKLIDAPRLQYAKAIGLTPDDVTGNAVASVKFKLPLLNDVAMKDVDIQAHADMNNVASSKLVKGINITNGALGLDLDKAGFGVKGSAALNKIPSQIEWSEKFDPQPGEVLQQGTVKAVLSDEQWRQPDLDMFKGSRGPVLAVIDVVKHDKETTSVTGNFDLTGAEMHVDQLKWIKPAGQAAKLDLDADIPIQGDGVIKALALTGPQVNVKGTGKFSTDDGALLNVSLDPFVIGRSDALLTYEQKPDGDKDLVLTATGNALDISGLKGGHDVEAKDPRPKEYHINVKKLYTGDDAFISDAEGFAIRDAQGWKAINIKGKADGDTAFGMELGDKNGKNTFEAYSDNFGKLMKGLGFTNTVSGGVIRVAGSGQANNPRVIEGNVKITGFTVKDFPALGVLLNATSPFGFADLISGTMSFDRLKGRFVWQGDNLELKEVHMPGPAVGIDVEGKIDMNSGNANLNGVVAPFSMVNNIVGSIPIIGDMLTGGNGGGVFAVAYTITGDLAKPKVGVNPASLLTPGFLRNLFFGSDDDSDDSSAKPAGDAPKVGSEPPKPPEATPNNLGRR